MAVVIFQRNYNLLDAELCMFVSNLCNFLTRDLSDFASFGLTTAKIASFKALGDAFEVFPTDGSLVGDVMVATEDKNAFREQVLAEIRNMALRVEAKWGAASGKYKRLDLRNPSQMSDDVLLVASRTVHKKMTEYMTDLADFGLTQAVLDAFEDLNEQFENARNAQADAVAMRDEKTNERIANGNELYALVTSYCSFGKSLYEKTNSAKYNNYLIYTSISPGSLTTPENLMFNAATKTLSWDTQENATSYQVRSSVNAVDFNEIYSGQENSFVYSNPIISKVYFQCRARNSNGFGKWCEVLEVI
jgi:hypothetical protein